jgi:Tol biopolymer transport system component/DNA-binding winged helix-turn-helix (wHTH) protein
MSRVRYEFGTFCLEPRRRRLARLDGTPVEISPKVFDALVYLIEHPGTVIPRDTLMESLWPRAIVEDNSLHKLIAALRHVLGSDSQRYIATVPGRGYQFVADVRAIEELPLEVETLAAVTDSDPDPMGETASARRESSGSLRWRRAISIAVIGGIVVSVALLGAFGPRLSGMRALPALDGVVRTLPATSYPGDERQPSLSPDGRQVAFSWEGGKVSQASNRDIYIASLGGGTEPLRLTTDPATDRDPAWSPDGTRIAFLRQRGTREYDLLVMPALGGAERKLYATRIWIDLELREHAPTLAWSPDSRHILFTSQSDDPLDAGSYRLYALSIDSGRVEPLSTDTNVFDSSPAVSGDSKWLAFSRFAIGARTSRLMIQPLGPGLQAVGKPTAVPIPLQENTPAAPHSPHWSADAGRLVFVVNGTLFEWERGGTTRALYTPSSPPGSVRYRGLSMHRSAERTHAVLEVEASLSDIWALPLDPRTHMAAGLPERRIASTAVDTHPRLSPDGREVAFMSWRSGQPSVWLSAPDGSNARQLTQFVASTFGFPRWSPDGKQITFHGATADEGRQIYIVPADGGVPRSLTSGCCAEWSLDGRHLYVTEIDDVPKITQVDIADGSRKRLFDGDLPYLTADGSSLVYAKVKEPGLFRRSIIGDPARNPEEKLVEDYVPPLGGIAMAAEGFYYVGHTPSGVPRALRFYDYSTGSAHDAAVLPMRTSQGLSLSADGRTLLYSASADSGSDLVVLEFE